MTLQLELLTENSSQWTTVTFVTPEIQKKEIKPFVILAIKELEGNPDSRTSSLMNADKFAAVRAVVRHLARSRSATKLPWRQEEVVTFLEGLRFSPECVSELASLLCVDEIYKNIPKHLRVKPGLASLHWKIDISLSQSNIQSVSPARSKDLLRHTHVILLLSLTDGSSHSYRMSVNKFHELRYCVAAALKSLLVLERRKCMRGD